MKNPFYPPSVLVAFPKKLFQVFTLRLHVAEKRNQTQRIPQPPLWLTRALPKCGKVVAQYLKESEVK